MGDLADEVDATRARAAYMPPLEPPVFVEAIDTWSGFFNGMAVGVIFIISLGFIAALGAHMEMTTKLIDGIHNNLQIVIPSVLFLAIMSSIFGLLLGRAYQRKREALKKIESQQSDSSSDTPSEPPSDFPSEEPPSDLPPEEPPMDDFPPSDPDSSEPTPELS
jgi:hypothetical protein